MRIGVLLFIGLWAALPLHAQELSLLRSLTCSTFTTPEGLTHTLNFNISRQLSISAAQSYQQALEISRQLPPNRFVVMGSPTKQMFWTGRVNPREIYPDLTFLQTSRQTLNYMVKKTNRLYMQEVAQLDVLWKEINTYMPQFQAVADRLPQPDNIPQWLADNVPEHTKNLFLSEVHGFDEIVQMIGACLPPLRKRFAERKIILFTEFLPERYRWNPNEPPNIPPHLQEHFPIWQTAQEQNISVIGLDPSFVIHSQARVQFTNHDGKTLIHSVWKTLEGMRLRNERWTKLLALYRARHPDALFIIYTGAGHALYNYPFSIPSAMKPGTSYVAAFYPSQMDVMDFSEDIPLQLITDKTDPLEHFNPSVSFPQKLLYWDSPVLSQISGFNARIKVDVDLLKKER